MTVKELYELCKEEIENDNGDRDIVLCVNENEFYPLENRFKGGIWKYKVNAKSIGSGKVTSWDVMPQTFNKDKIGKGSIILVEDWSKNAKGYFELYHYKRLIEV